jgi:hypothetical protein
MRKRAGGDPVMVMPEDPVLPARSRARTRLRETRAIMERKSPIMQGIRKESGRHGKI